MGAPNNPPPPPFPHQAPPAPDPKRDVLTLAGLSMRGRARLDLLHFQREGRPAVTSHMQATDVGSHSGGICLAVLVEIRPCCGCVGSFGQPRARRRRMDCCRLFPLGGRLHALHPLRGSNTPFLSCPPVPTTRSPGHTHMDCGPVPVLPVNGARKNTAPGGFSRRLRWQFRNRRRA